MRFRPDRLGRYPGMIGFGYQMYGDISKVAPRARPREMSLNLHEAVMPHIVQHATESVRLASRFDGIETRPHRCVTRRVEFDGRPLAVEVRDGLLQLPRPAP